MLILAILFVFLFIVLAVFFFYTAMLLTIFFEAPFVPSSQRATKVMLEAAKIISGEMVYDLGSGDGRLVRGAARLGATATGVERSRLLVLFSRILNVLVRKEVRPPSDRRSNLQISNPKYICDSFYNVDLSDADVVFTYLFPNVMAKLKTKFEKELRPGARVVSYAFKVPGWTANRRIEFSPKRPAVYVYIR